MSALGEAIARLGVVLERNQQTRQEVTRCISGVRLNVTELLSLADGTENRNAIDAIRTMRYAIEGLHAALVALGSAEEQVKAFQHDLLSGGG